jgi:hypothetical protein
MSRTVMVVLPFHVTHLQEKQNSLTELARKYRSSCGNNGLEMTKLIDVVLDHYLETIH